MREFVFCIAISIFTLPVKASLYKKTSKYAYFYDREKKEGVYLKLYKGIQVYSYNTTSMAHDVIKKYRSYPVKIEIKNFDISPASKICQLYKGDTGVIYDIHLNEMPTCVFSYKSYFVSWD